MNQRQLLQMCLVIVVIWLSVINAKPVENEHDLNATKYETVTMPVKHIVDIDNLKNPDVINLLTNIDIDYIKKLQEEKRKEQSSGQMTERNYFGMQYDSSTQQPQPTEKEIEEQTRLSMIKEQIHQTIFRNGSQDELPMKDDKHSDSRSSEDEDQTTHDIAFPAVCEVPRGTNTSDWFGSKTWNLYFKPSNVRQANIETAILRIFKLPHQSSNNFEKCNDLDNLLTVTVSVYLRKKKEIKKKVLHTKMVSQSEHGWIEFDIKHTIRTWENVNKNFGLSVDVYDQDEAQLKAHNYFRMQDCQADEHLLPWSFYEYVRENTNQVVEMPSKPRLDIKYSSYDRKVISHHQNQRSRHSRHIKHHENSPQHLKSSQVKRDYERQRESSLNDVEMTIIAHDLLQFLKQNENSTDEDNISDEQNT